MFVKLLENQTVFLENIKINFRKYLNFDRRSYISIEKLE